MKKLAEIYGKADERQRHLAIAIFLIVLGLLLLVTKAIAGTPANSQNVVGFVAGMTGLYMICQETQ